MGDFNMGYDGQDAAVAAFLVAVSVIVVVLSVAAAVIFAAVKP